MAISAIALGAAVAGGAMDMSQSKANREMTNYQLDAQRAALTTDKMQHDLDVARSQSEFAQMATQAIGQVTASQSPTQQSSATSTAVFNITQQTYKADADARRSVQMNEMNYQSAMVDIDSQKKQNKSTKKMDRRGAALGAGTTYFALAGLPAAGDKEVLKSADDNIFQLNNPYTGKGGRW